MSVVHRLHSLSSQATLDNSEESPEVVNESPEPAPTPSPALALINSVTEASELVVLPGIGSVSAGLILTARPEDGFTDLAAVVAVPGLPSSVTVAALEGWEPQN